MAHGQGTVAVVQLNPDPARPYADDPTGKPNAESVVIGRARGEQRADGTYHGHITIAALFGNEIVGVDTNPGETKAGPLDAVQQNLLNPLCNGSGNQICLSAVVANSTTTSTGSTNHFEAAHVTLGGAQGIDTGIAQSDGNISQTATCQTATGSSRVANAKVGGSVVANLLQSGTTSNAGNCGSAPAQTNTSSVIGLGGQDVPIPAPGCANGTPNTVTGIPTLLPLICNADDIQPGGTSPAQASAPYGVRDALDAFLLATGTTAAAKLTTAASESHAIAPPGSTGGGNNGGGNTTTGGGNSGNVCNTGGDNDCVSGTGPTGPSIPEGGKTDHGRDCSEGVENTTGCAGASTGAPSGSGRCNTGGDNDCVTGAGPFGPKLPEGGSVDHSRDCTEGVTNEGPTTCAAGAATIRQAATLPFTGLDLIPLTLIGFALLGGGLALRRRAGTH